MQIGQQGHSFIGRSIEAEQIDEDFERDADGDPSRFEFLGKSIDAGFRSPKHARADQIALSLELAYILARECHRRNSGLRFTYPGREVLKGVVIQDRPYPIVTIDAERRQSRREVRVREASLLANPPQDPLHLADFLEAFMTDEGIEFPLLGTTDVGVRRRATAIFGRLGKPKPSKQESGARPKPMQAGRTSMPRKMQRTETSRHSTKPSRRFSS